MPAPVITSSEGEGASMRTARARRHSAIAAVSPAARETGEARPAVTEGPEQQRAVPDALVGRDRYAPRQRLVCRVNDERGHGDGGLK